MQTFLPHRSFSESAKVLDDKRLGKQRSETIIILKTLLGYYEKEGRKGWPHHPATKMWTGYEAALSVYGLTIASEWEDRGFEDTTYDIFEAWSIRLHPESIGLRPPMPPWLGDEQFHLAHRSNLLRKMPEHYRQYWPDERDDLPYIWPV